MRAEYEAARDATDSAIAVVDTGIVIEVPPENCDADTFAAQSDLAAFNDSLADLLTYLEWLEGQRVDDCASLAADLAVETEQVNGQTADVDAAIDATLENLAQLTASEGEQIADFATRMREAFAADVMAPAVDAGIEAPTVPEDCADDTDAAAATFAAAVAEYEDALSYQAWLEAQLLGACTDLKDAMTGAIDAIEAPDVAAVTDELFELKGNDGETKDDYLLRLFNDFAAARAATESAVAEQVTGIEIPDVPEQCDASVAAERQALVAADAELQHQLTFAEWAKEQLAKAQQMNQEECDALAGDYDQIVADGQALIEAAQARQETIKADWFITDGADGESFAEFKARVKGEFETYVPIPITPDVSCPALPDTCETES